MNDLEELKALEEFKDLTEIQKAILFEHLSDPNKNKAEVAKKLNLNPATVWRFFHTKTFEKINEELANLEKRELLQIAIKTLRELLTCKSDMVRLAAANKVLSDAGILQSELKSLKQNNNITVIWDKKEDNGSKDILYPTSETVGSASRFIPFSSNSGRKEIGKDNPGS